MNTTLDIPNPRSAFLDTVDQLLQSGGDHPRAMLVINVRHLREINITAGIATTDQLLLQLCAHFSTQVRPGDLVVHIGGDEFAVFLSALPSLTVAELAASKLHSSLRPTVSVNGLEIPIRLSIGIAQYSAEVQNAADLLRNALIAVGQARQTDQDTVVFNAAMESDSTDILSLRKELRAAIEVSALMLHYQPKIRLETGTISGAEALMRWHSPERGWIRPDIFIPIAEKSDLIEPLTFWSINAALRQCSICSTKLGCLSVAVNLSAKLLHHPHLVEVISRAMDIWGTAPGSLTLEVTESAMMSDPSTSMKALQTLADAGVTLSIDDFGTGYSSLAYLKKLPIHELKIDKSFVLNMHDDRSDENIVRAIIDLSHNLGVSVVAEGVENQATLDKLAQLGCDYAQGYHIAKPMSAEDMIKWTGTSDWTVRAAI